MSTLRNEVDSSQPGCTSFCISMCFETTAPWAANEVVGWVIFPD